MHNRWVNLAVIALWLVTMTWLVRVKVLPTLLIGEPPNSETILAARGLDPLVGWRVCLNDKPIGWALSLTRSSRSASTDILSRVHFDDLPLGRFTPGWLRALVGSLASLPSHIEADARSKLVLDANGRLKEIESSVWFDSLREEVSLMGRVEDSQMALVIRSGDLTYRTTTSINTKAIQSEVLTPQTQLPGLHEGQTWTVEVCSPLGYPNSAVDVVEARVVGYECIVWQGAMVNAWLVEYHNPPTSRLSKNREPRGRLWVRADGTVLIQEISLFNSRMKFVRLHNDEAHALAAREKWLAAE